MPRSFVPTDEQRRRVKMLASLGQRHKQIAMVVGIRSTTTLRKHFREELTRGPAEAMANVRKTLFQMATSGKHPAATMFWLKTRARWEVGPGESERSRMARKPKRALLRSSRAVRNVRVTWLPPYSQPVDSIQ